jgi:hypothetical protein
MLTATEIKITNKTNKSGGENKNEITILFLTTSLKKFTIIFYIMQIILNLKQPLYNY